VHAGLAVGARVSLRLAVEAGDVAPLLEGAGFEGLPRASTIAAIRLRTLPDVVAPGMRLLVCGLNPSLYSADAGVNFARPGNRFWPAALAAGIVSVARDPWHALVHHGVGFTDLVKRPTVAAGELGAAEYRHGVARLAWTVALLKPATVVFVGLTGYRAAIDRTATAGPQPGGFAGAAAYLMPNTSGLNAHARPADFARHLAAAAGPPTATASTDRRG
jgi:TDG/mug DNA glycosylase family protein